MNCPNVHAYPALKRALVEIAYDNGMVNRDHIEWLVIYDMLLLVTKKYTTLQIADVNRQLAALSDERLVEVCVGGRENNDPPKGLDQLADDMLDWAFDGDVTTLEAP
ncbi:MAG: hypothetical protein ACRYGA_02080 [Janthinobacterium lividum]